MPDAPAPMTQRSGVETLAKPDLYRRFGRTVPLLAATGGKGQQPERLKSRQTPNLRPIWLRHRVRGQIPGRVDLAGLFLYSPDQSQPRDGSAFAGLLQRGSDPAQVTT
jgi:hypothetical protein